MDEVCIDVEFIVLREYGLSVVRFREESEGVRYEWELKIIQRTTEGYHVFGLTHVHEVDEVYEGTVVDDVENSEEGMSDRYGY